MQTKLPPLRFSLMVLCALNLQSSTACAQGTAFTYQGRLNDGANPASGIYDLRFAIYDASGGGGVVAGPVTNTPPSVSNGLFTVTLDFGVGVFTGAERWLDIGVRTNGYGAFTAFAPRQKLAAAPYAILAGNVSGTVAAAQIDPAIARATNVFPTVLANDGSGSGLDADRLDGFSAEDFWRLGGNAGTTPGAHFVGTTDSQPLEFKVSNLRALRLELNGGDAPNLIGGAPDNAAAPSVRGATIAGGKVNLIGTDAHFSVVGGGGDNSVGNGSSSATIAGGYRNTIGPRAGLSVIGGGNGNLVVDGSLVATIAGGEANVIHTNADYGAIGGGRLNYVIAQGATIAGGMENAISNNANYAALGGGWGNKIESDATLAVVSGGFYNIIGPSADYAAVGGGDRNAIGADAAYAVIAGGNINYIGTNAGSSVIGGGRNNSIANNASFATVPGGLYNTATNYAFAAGHRARAIHTGAFVWADNSQNTDFTSTASNQFLIRASGGVGINRTNPATALDVNGTISAGRMGIGTTTPAAPLHIQSGAVGVGLNSRTVLGLERVGDTWLQMITTTNNHAGIIFGSPNDSLDASLRYNNLGGRELAFRTLQSTRMVILTNGNVGIANSGPADRFMVANARCDGSSWINASDRRLKQDFTPVDAKAVLEKVVALPVQQWSYQAQPGQKHLGPVAQEFRAAFGLGADDTSIATVDADGVALAAIQGLNQKLEKENHDLRGQLQSLRGELSALRLLVERGLPEKTVESVP